jgi:hypothetical protein
MKFLLPALLPLLFEMCTDKLYLSTLKNKKKLKVSVKKFLVPMVIILSLFTLDYFFLIVAIKIPKGFYVKLN